MIPKRQATLTLKIVWILGLDMIFTKRVRLIKSAANIARIFSPLLKFSMLNISLTSMALVGPNNDDKTRHAKLLY